MAAQRRVARIRGSMQESVEQAVADMSWLKPSDSGMVAIAVKFAAEIDKAGDDQRAVGYLGQNLMAVLKSLGGAPAERKALDIEGAVRGRVAELRAARSGRQRDAAAVDPAGPGADS